MLNRRRLMFGLAATAAAASMPVPVRARSGVPVGVVMPYAGEQVPPGWLVCHGQSVGQRTYPELFEAIGRLYGSDERTFKLPDFSPKFVLPSDQPVLEIPYIIKAM